MELRPHQDYAVNELRRSLSTGHKRPMLAAPCSFGKTIVAAYMLKSAVSKGKRAVFICDRIKLIEQSLVSFDAHGLDFGVIQGDHWKTDYSKPLQIASAQTLARRIEKHGLKAFPWDFAIIDEAHTHYKYLTRIMEKFDKVPMIGLSATPFSKGLGKYYDDLIVPTTPRELLAGGYLCPVDYYGGRKVALEGVRTKAIPTGGRDFDDRDLARSIESDVELTGDIIANWKRHAEGRQTVAFSPSIQHSKFMVDMFRAAGIPAEHIDGYMDAEEREDILKAHDAGEFLVLSCSKLLNTGWDSPSTSCLIDCYPTKSYITYVQRIGRVMRTAEGKENAIVLDHSNNVSTFGFAEDIVPTHLDDGDEKYDERKQTNKDEEKTEPKVKDCPQCYREFIGLRCSCGYEIPIREQLETTEEELVKLSKVDNKLHTKEQKRDFYAMLTFYAQDKGYNKSWADHKYRERYQVWPNAIDKKTIDPIRPDQDTMNWIKSRQIAFAKAREAKKVSPEVENAVTHLLSMGL